MKPEERPETPRLTLVGTGILAGLQTTAEARSVIRNADRVFHLLNGPVAEAWIRKLAPEAEKLAEPMVENVLSALRYGTDVCVALYGHPAVFVSASHEMVSRAREEGFTASITAGVSFEDCLYVDLDFDPAARGCRSFDATDFLLYGRTIDPQSALVLWQVGAIGYGSGGGLELLREALGREYTADHEVFLYEASTLPISEPQVASLRLADLHSAETNLHTTLYVPPLAPGPPDEETARRLGVSIERP